MKQLAKLNEQFFAKHRKNATKVKLAMTACENLMDYKILCYLMADGQFENNTNFDIELFIHRLGKKIGVTLEEEHTNADTKV